MIGDAKGILDQVEVDGREDFSASQIERFKADPAFYRTFVKAIEKEVNGNFSLVREPDIPPARPPCIFGILAKAAFYSDTKRQPYASICRAACHTVHDCDAGRRREAMQGTQTNLPHGLQEDDPWPPIPGSSHAAECKCRDGWNQESHSARNRPRDRGDHRAGRHCLRDWL